MKKFIYLFIIIFFATTSYAQNVADTSIVNEKLEKEIIEEIVITKKAPTSREKEQYLSQVTKYGFKNLFTRYSYNATAPYTSQVNPNAESFMQDYLKAHSKHLLQMKGWGTPYFNLIDNILSQYGLPKELKYVAVIESNLKVGATSWVGAAGPWQFMPATAREYGLVVNGYVDERRDYVKSTHAAARYLLNSYKVYHDWLLVLASYNGGLGNVNKAIRKSGSKNFWSLQYSLPSESRNYVKKFIATHYIMEGGGGVTTQTSTNGGIGYPMTTEAGGGINPFNNTPNLTDAESDNALTQTISGKYNSMVITKNLAMEVVQFNRYNPQFDNMMSTHGNYDLRLPADKMQLFIANKYIILNECVQMLLGDDTIASNQTVYPATKTVKKKKKR